MAENPYYPVTTNSDTNHLREEDEWGLTTDVIYEKPPSSKRFKRACMGLNNMPRCSVVIFISVCILILIIVVIGIAASHSESSRHPGTEPSRTVKELGLNFFPAPEDGTILIRFKQHKFRNDEPIIKSMNQVLKPYEHSNQIDEKKYTSCSASNKPYNKTCKFPLISLTEPECSQIRGYGYGYNLPCVLLQLDVPKNLNVKPISEGSPLWEDVKGKDNVIALLDGTSDIPVSCEGQTKEDKKIFQSMIAIPSDGKLIRYFPKQSLPTYFYRKRDMSKDFIKPAVMLQFTSLLEKHVVHITCTAWAQAFLEDGAMYEHDLLQTTFAIFIEE